MKTLKVSALALLLGSGYAVAGDCTAPAMPTLPDGATASMEQMLEGQKAVKTFQAANLDYMKCLEPGLTEAKTKAEAGEEGASDTYNAALEVYNAAVSSEEDLAGRFNQAVRDYKAANPG